MNFIPSHSPDSIDEMRLLFYKRLLAPIDGMWESLYIPSSTAYLILDGNDTLGYCCIDADKSLTQLFVKAGTEYQTTQVVKALIDSQLIVSAKLSSIEPIAFNACLSLSTSLASNTLCYQYSKQSRVTAISSPIEPVKATNIAQIKDFFREHIGFDDNFGYTENLVDRGELYAFQSNHEIIATGECRLSDTQQNIADIGMIVSSAHRGKGLGSEVLHQLAQKANKLHRTPICSTTQDNIPSQKSIEKAGFYCSHIIFDMAFTPTDIN